MPNQTSYDCATALERDGEISRGNTEVKGGYLILFGNKIAYKAKTGGIFITNCGWTSRTTFDRLNALNGVMVSYRGGILELNGNRWDGEWTKI